MHQPPTLTIAGRHVTAEKLSVGWAIEVTVASQVRRILLRPIDRKTHSERPCWHAREGDRYVSLGSTMAEAATRAYAVLVREACAGTPAPSSFLG